MKNTQRVNTVWMLALCAALTIGFMLKGCDRDHDNPTAPRQGVTLKLAGNPAWQAKATGLTVKAEGLDDTGNPNGQDVVEHTVTNLNFPVEVPLMLYKPPCRWRITATITLTRDAPLTAWDDLDICTSTVARLHLDPFEPFHIASGENPIQAPLSAEMGETIPVRCGPIAINAPDSDQYPVSAVLSEQGGQSVSGPIHANAAVSGEFPDPYPLSSAETVRTFTCTIRDGRSQDRTFSKSVQRILPTPTPTVTPTITPTPPPDPCQVKNLNDSGPDSLRAILDSLACSTITFAPAVQGQTITLTTGQLTVANNVTIDGGAGVTISGNNNSRVFYVNSGTTVTLSGLTITQGWITGTGSPSGDCTGCGGGIYNNGTMTLNGNTIVTGNAAYEGGGIWNNSGTLTIDGVVSNNTADRACGGILNWPGTTIIKGTITHNRAGSGGGVCNWGTLFLNGTIDSNIGNFPAGGAGGGIYSGGITRINGTIRNNIADSGGGIFCSGVTLDIVANNAVIHNHATGTGGGIYRYNGYGAIVTGATVATVSNNTAGTSCNNYYSEGALPVPCILP